jgi:hypothetical protein
MRKSVTPYLGGMVFAMSEIESYNLSGKTIIPCGREMGSYAR